MGRGVRGERDYCVIIITGADLINVIRTPRLRRNFSAQTQRQIAIGLDVTKMVSADAESGDPVVQLDDIIKQCLNRDEDWKDYYQREMGILEPLTEDAPIYHIMELERAAAVAYRRGDPDKAQQLVQEIITNHLHGDEEEKGWYMQEMGRYAYAEQRVAAEKHQAAAYRYNQALLKPNGGAYFRKLVTSQTQVEGAKEWLASFESFELCRIAAEAILSNLEFGRESDKFEAALKDVGLLLGFGSEQPDKRWKEGPDNLWNVGAGDYIYFECKNATKPTRMHIYKSEAGQVSQHQLWFEEQYHDATAVPVIISRTRMLASDARLTDETRIMEKTKLAKLSGAIRSYLKEFKTYSLKDLSTDFVQEALRKHFLTSNNIKTHYLERPLPFTLTGK
ncbi:hypothetical protein [Hymenobacter coccineus]|uniref:hypothetical protein n=1 Tax=Hymenobacter coccineus TaxID=1908235 RepID=UPI001873EFCF|nr:hypothetical protein [Hymenobacter coccineus]